MSPKSEFYLRDGKTYYEAKCDYPGCCNYAVSDLSMRYQKRIIGDIISFVVHTFACRIHEAALDEMQRLLHA